MIDPEDNEFDDIPNEESNDHSNEESSPVNKDEETPYNDLSPDEESNDKDITDSKKMSSNEEIDEDKLETSEMVTSEEHVNIDDNTNVSIALNLDDANEKENQSTDVPIEEVPKTEEEIRHERKLKRVKRYITLLKVIWVIFFSGLAAVFFFFYTLSSYLPSFEELENPRSIIASNIYSTDGELLGKYFVENRTLVHYDSLSPFLIDALVATEDSRFYTHSGIDPRAIGRVIVKTLLFNNKGSGGGSTISQQLAKLLVGRPDTRNAGKIERLMLLFTTKFKEWLTAVKLERSYTKEEIIALYFNKFDFLYGANGIKSAAEIYYKKTPSNLTITEAAMLVRMLKNPDLYNPKKFPEKAKKGREQVLRNMFDAGKITEEEYHHYRQLPIDMSNFGTSDHNDGMATHFRMYMRDHIKNLLKRLAAEDKLYQKPDGSPYDIYRDGLKIYTTIDSRVQRHAEKAVFDHLKSHQKKLFKVWKDWNAKDPEISYRSKNPWTYKTSKNTYQEMELRQKGLRRQMWQSSRYQNSRPKLMPIAQRLSLRDVDLERIFTITSYDKKPRKDAKGNRIDGKKLFKKWKNTGFITEKQAKLYQEVLTSKTYDSLVIERENMLKYMNTPVKMRIFAFNKKGEVDTIMSPFDSIRYHRMHLQTGMLAVNPRTGHVKAWVGGLNHKYFKFDHVNKDRAARQVGSTIKPFLYGLTVDLKGFSPCQKVWDEPTTISKDEGQFGLIEDWTPRNADGYSGEEITLTEALNRSLNSVSAFLIKDLKSAEPFRNFLADLGIDTSNNRVPSYPSICLGTPNLSPFEMTGGYTIFANEGTYTEPIFIDRIEDKNGNLIYSAAQDQRIESILSKQGAYVMNQMLQRIQRNRLPKVKAAYGGKTGTTNYHADGWFMGITPDMVIGTWVGCDDRFIRFKTLANGQGARMARPIFEKLLMNMEADSTLALDKTFDPTRLFPKPAIIEREMDCLKYENLNDYNVIPVNDATDEDIYNEDDY